MGYKYDRVFRHMQHKRAWSGIDNEIRELASVLRYGSSRKSNAFRLDPWDEQWVKNPRCWKKHRDHQYKVKVEREKRCSARYGEHMARRDHWHDYHRYCYISRCRYCTRNGIHYMWPAKWS